MAAPTVPLAVHAATAEVRRPAGNPGSTNANDVGTVNDPPIPCSTRPATKTFAVGATTQMSEANKKIQRPAKNIRRRPRLSDKRPAGTMKVASAIEYPERAHDSVERLVSENSSVMAGNAIFVPVSVMLMTVYVSAASASANQLERGTDSSFWPFTCGCSRRGHGKKSSADLSQSSDTACSRQSWSNVYRFCSSVLCTPLGSAQMMYRVHVASRSPTRTTRSRVELEKPSC